MEVTGIIDLRLSDLFLVYGLVILAIGLGRLQQVGQGKEILIASVRMVFQLLAVGYVLKAVFTLRTPAPIILLLVVMALFAVQTVGSRVKYRMPRFYRVVGTAIFIGCGGATFFLCNLVIAVEPWFDPQYLIPLAGMIIGNSMTGASLAAERLASEIRERRDEIETSLCLGASAHQAARQTVRNAFRAALIPSINSMAAMGIVFLPGMMTGQILSGTEPVVAVKYQIAIMCVITGSVAVTALLIVVQGYRGYFTDAHQLIIDFVH